MTSKQRLAVYLLAIVLIVVAAITLRKIDFVGTIQRLHG